MARKTPYNKTVNYIITVNGEYAGEKDSLSMARKFIKTELPKVEPSSKIHIVRQVITETVVDYFEYTMKPVLNSASLDGDL